jgi:hypothetical protein
MRPWHRALLFLSIMLFLSVAMASADTLITYQITGSVTASFTVPVNPTQLKFVDLGFGFSIMPINLVINGVPSNDLLDFFSAAQKGGFDACSPGATKCTDLNFTGPQFYSGSELSPTFLPLNGATLSGFFPSAPGAPAGGTVTTPEPSAFGMLAFGMLGLLASRLKFRSPTTFRSY